MLHVCGSFHCERRLGVVEMVEALSDGSFKVLVVVMVPEKDCHQFVRERHAGLGDFVILTDASLARTHDYMMDVSPAR